MTKQALIREASSKVLAAKVLSANRLSDGVSVWLAADGHWAETLHHALIARHPEMVAALEQAGEQASRSNLVVDVNLVDVEERGEGLYPLRLRERIRLNGPSIVPLTKLYAVNG